MTIGERVVTAQRNVEFWDTLHAIHHKTIPPDVLNEFVNLYPNFKVPIIDFDRLDRATNHKMGFDSIELSNKIDKTNEKLERVVDAVSAIGMKIHMDENGFSASLETWQQKERNRKRS